MPHPQQALIIGVGPGLGAALARRFGREGFTLTIAARHQEHLDAIASELRSEGLAVDTLVLDAADPAATKARLKALSERIDPDVVIYNAAVIASDDILTADIDRLSDAYNVDALGAIVTAQVFVPGMKRRGSGTLLLTGGRLGVDPDPAYGTLSVGKAALRAVGELLFQELAADGVHAASITVSGAIRPETPFAPELIADRFWAVHTQEREQWVGETVFDGSAAEGSAV
ncbi:SDR family NAD(P)-dependent oxidoreductase [Actinomyces sp. 594]|uniref:SDR family NAD(P)-dependent oxidoreductase n=1 Tax=Actinomyces sp. 594 TaxID=2057793 RepID=UPI001C55FC45|nr:SDR family NAD(P)-dependent oxidoreductase [Actinomyces sp. 594]MBW3069375.1 SDR family NAD(P)-dependent oxidoreductase [Actinomyces sp. 594]